jgi:hypothetical protein
MQLLLDGSLHLADGERIDLVEELKELEAIVSGQKIEPERQRLPQLDPHSTERLERRLRTLRPRRTAAAQGPWNDDVPEENAKDLPGAPDDPEHQDAFRDPCTAASLVRRRCRCPPALLPTAVTTCIL